MYEEQLKVLDIKNIDASLSHDREIKIAYSPNYDEVLLLKSW